MSVWKSEKKLPIFASLTSKIILFAGEATGIDQAFDTVFHHRLKHYHDEVHQKYAAARLAYESISFFRPLFHPTGKNLSAGKIRAEKPRCSCWLLSVVFETFFSRSVFPLRLMLDRTIFVRP